MDNRYTRGLAEFGASLKYETIPAEVRERLKLLILDALGCALYGAHLPWCRLLNETLLEVEKGGSCAVWGTGERLSAPHAALANGTQVQSFELDDVHRAGVLHVGGVVLPALIAVAELKRKLSGKEFLTAAATGYEIGPRVGLCMGPEHIGQGWHSGATIGVFAAGAAAARGLRLDANKTVHALGIAGSLCSGLLAFAHAGNGAMVKRLHLGRAAESGILAARLAESGFEGPDTILEGASGFLDAYCDETDPALLTAGLGERWETRKLCIKRYACHVTAHTAVESVRALRDEHRFGADDVSAIRIRASANVVHLRSAREARDVMALQYSLPFCVAVALIDDVDDPLAFGDRALRNPEVHALARKVACEPWPDAPSGWASEVRITLRDGRTLERAEDDFPGTPTRPLSAAQLRAKFLRCAGSCAHAEALLEQLAAIASVPDVAALPLS